MPRSIIRTITTAIAIAALAAPSRPRATRRHAPGRRQGRRRGRQSRTHAAHARLGMYTPGATPAVTTRPHQRALGRHRRISQRPMSDRPLRAADLTARHHADRARRQRHRLDDDRPRHRRQPARDRRHRRPHDPHPPHRARTHHRVTPPLGCRPSCRHPRAPYQPFVPSLIEMPLGRRRWRPVPSLGGEGSRPYLSRPEDRRRRFVVPRREDRRQRSKRFVSGAPGPVRPKAGALAAPTCRVRPAPGPTTPASQPSAPTRAAAMAALRSSCAPSRSARSHRRDQRATGLVRA